MTPLSLLFSALSPGGDRGRLAVFIFHRVLARRDPLMPEEPDAQRFDEICRWLAAWFNVLALDEAVARLQVDSLPPRAAAITFDDGYLDNHDVALPILQRHRLPATFFVATGFLDGGRMWNDTLIETVRRCRAPILDARGLWAGPDAVSELPMSDDAARRRAIDVLIGRCKYLSHARRLEVVAALAERAAVALPADLMMQSRQVQALARAGMQIGAHTVTHPILAGLDDRTVADEVGRSKHDLEALTGERVRLFAYPNGRPGQDYDARCVGIVARAGFDAAFSTAAGVASRRDDCWQLPRFTPWDRARWRFGARMVSTMMQPGEARRVEAVA
jgi:peptidoglycan/xylan/chitin deacetylase (PgdA/CDA1 family)